MRMEELREKVVEKEVYNSSLRRQVGYWLMCSWWMSDGTGVSVERKHRAGHFVSSRFV